MDLRSEVEDEAWIEEIRRDWRSARHSAQDRALLEFAEKLTRRPEAMTAADCQALREHGLDDRGIHDLVQVVAYFNYINRVADGLGTDLEEFFPPRPPRAR